MIKVLGVNPGKQALELRRQFGYVSDSRAFHDEMTALEVGGFASSLCACMESS